MVFGNAQLCRDIVQTHFAIVLIFQQLDGLIYDCRPLVWKRVAAAVSIQLQNKLIGEKRSFVRVFNLLIAGFLENITQSADELRMFGKSHHLLVMRFQI